MKSAPLTLHASPAAGFEQPFEMLRACHERVQRMCALLLRLQQHLTTHGVDSQARQAATDVLRYFDTAGPAHHEDEERHVLPWLRAQGHGDWADRLAQDHHLMGLQWAQIRPALLQVESGTWAPDAATRASTAWPAYAALYAAHIEAEENQAYPAAEAALTSAACATMGLEMAARRGLPPPK